ncbi:MAG: PQQ-dependent sugar dehydrogenase [Candidatus Paceibacterota bacterium]|jgi:glucose/arabinose dehydrogenase
MDPIQLKIINRKTIKYLVIIILVVVLSYVVIFLWINFSGVWPIVKRPSENIVDIIKEGKKPLSIKDGSIVSVYAKDLGDPRVLQFAPGGSLFVSVPGKGKIYALIDGNNDGVAEENRVVAENLNDPHGFAFKCEAAEGGDEKCKMYIAETDKVSEFDFDKANLTATNVKKIVDLPADGRHITRTIMFMPSPDENKLLISVGSSCDVCVEKNADRAKILVYDLGTKDLKDFATGLRNSVFMAIHPVNGKIWATEMGRDFLGDDLPPDEINIIEDGKNYGWPICYGKNIHDADFDKNTYIRNPCMEPFETPSYIDIPAHSAPLGLAYIPEEGWPEDMWYNLLVAYHGSWNRSTPAGYKIVRYKLDKDGKYLGEEDFMAGWLTSDGALGRPVDILALPGGTLYISDDRAGVVYRVTYRQK